VHFRVLTPKVQVLTLAFEGEGCS